MSNRLEHKKMCLLNGNTSSTQRYENHFKETLTKSVPSKFGALNIVGPFLQLFTLLTSINIQATSYLDKYSSLDGQSFNNKILDK